jgi:hypothetical protein
MRHSPAAAAVLVMLVGLAAPSGALAQSAGDEQYTDPFQDVPAEQDQGSSGSQGQVNSGSQGGGDQGGEATAPAPPVEAPTGEVPATEPTASNAPTLPRSGLPAAALGIVGLFLLAGGVTLRRAA